MERTYVERGINELLLDIAAVTSWASEDTDTMSRLGLLVEVLGQASSGLRQQAVVDRALYFTQQVALHAAQIGYADLCSAAEARAHAKGGAHFRLRWASGVGMSSVGRISREGTDYWWSVALSHDGELIAAGDKAGQVVIWATGLCSRLREFSAEVGPVEHLAFVGDRHVLVAASRAGAIKLWDANRGTLIRELVAGHTGLTDMAASHNSQHFVACFDDGSIKVWDIEDSDDAEGRQLVGPALPGETPPKFVRAVYHNDSLRVIAISADSKLLAVNAEGKVEQRLDVGQNNTGQDKIWGLVISPCGEYAVIIAGRKTAPVWRISTGEKIGELEADSSITSVAICSAAGFAVLAEFIGMVSIVDWPPTGTVRRVLGSHGGGLGAKLQMPADGSVLIATAPREMKVWHPSTTMKTSIRPGHTARITGLSHLPHGQMCISASWDKTVKVWDILSGEMLRDVQENSGEILWLCRVIGLTVITGAIAEILEIDLAEQKLVQKYDYWKHNYSRIAATPDGDKLVCTSSNGLVVVNADGRWQQIGKHEYGLNIVVITEDGKHAFTSGGDGTVKRWNLETYSEDDHFSVHESKVYELALVPGTTYLFSGSEDGSLTLFDWKAGREIHAFSHKGEREVYGVASSPDGQYVAAAGVSGVRLWEVATCRLIASCVLWDIAGRLHMPTPDLLLAGDDSGNVYCLELKQ